MGAIVYRVEIMQNDEYCHSRELRTLSVLFPSPKKSAILSQFCLPQARNDVFLSYPFGPHPDTFELGYEYPFLSPLRVLTVWSST